MPLSPEERSLRGQVAAEASWSNTEDRSSRTAPARQAMLDKFADADDPEQARREYYQSLARKSAETRRRNKLRKDQSPLQQPELKLSLAFTKAQRKLDEALSAILHVRDMTGDEYGDELDNAFHHAREAYRWVDDVRQFRAIQKLNP